MKVSQIVYKVDNLKEAVKKAESYGFTVEYGKMNKPYNALIYFSEGPYIELLESSGIPSGIKNLMYLFGMNQLAYRFDYWDTAHSGMVGIALETTQADFIKKKNYLKSLGIKGYQMPSKRVDTYGRKLECKCLFPECMELPFFMSEFKKNPKPVNYIHPNGAKEIISVSFGTQKKYYPVIRELCSQDILKLHLGQDIKELMIVDEHGNQIKCPEF